MFRAAPGGARVGEVDPNPQPARGREREREGAECRMQGAGSRVQGVGRRVQGAVPHGRAAPGGGRVSARSVLRFSFSTKPETFLVSGLNQKRLSLRFQC